MNLVFKTLKNVIYLFIFSKKSTVPAGQISICVEQYISICGRDLGDSLIVGHFADAAGTEGLHRFCVRSTPT